MSIRLMDKVWSSALPQNLKYTLLAYADFANDDGIGVYPSVPYMAWKTGYSDSQIQRNTRTLLDKGILVHVGTTQYGTNQYVIDTGKLPERPSWQETRNGGNQNRGSQNATGGSQNATRGVAKCDQGGRKMRPDPSVEPSVEPSSSGKSETEPNSGVAEVDEFEELFGPQPEHDGVLENRRTWREHAEAEPWVFWHQDGVTPRPGVSKVSLQRVGWLIEEETGLAPTDRGMKGWVSALAEIYDAGNGDFDVIRKGVRAAWDREMKYRPGHANGFVDTVRKAAAERKKTGNKRKYRGVKMKYAPRE